MRVAGPHPNPSPASGRGAWCGGALIVFALKPPPTLPAATPAA
ncbi:hypothetical protein [Lysobacter gummosus]